MTLRGMWWGEIDRVLRARASSSSSKPYLPSPHLTCLTTTSRLVSSCSFFLSVFTRSFLSNGWRRGRGLARAVKPIAASASRHRPTTPINWISHQKKRGRDVLIKNSFEYLQTRNRLQSGRKFIPILNIDYASSTLNIKD